MGKRGRARVEQNFHWPKIVGKHIPPVLDEVLAKRRQVRGGSS